MIVSISALFCIGKLWETLIYSWNDALYQILPFIDADGDSICTVTNLRDFVTIWYVVLWIAPSRTTARLQHKNHFRFHLTKLLLLFYILHSTTCNPLRFQQSTPPVPDKVSILKLLPFALLSLVDRQASGLTD